jgi:hypothetical protein
MPVLNHSCERTSHEHVKLKMTHDERIKCTNIVLWQYEWVNMGVLLQVVLTNTQTTNSREHQQRWPRLQWTDTDVYITLSYFPFLIKIIEIWNEENIERLGMVPMEVCARQMDLEIQADTVYQASVSLLRWIEVFTELMFILEEK